MFTVRFQISFTFGRDQPRQDDAASAPLPGPDTVIGFDCDVNGDQSLAEYEVPEAGEDFPRAGG